MADGFGMSGQSLSCCKIENTHALRCISNNLFSPILVSASLPVQPMYHSCALRSSFSYMSCLIVQSTLTTLTEDTIFRRCFPHIISLLCLSLRRFVCTNICRNKKKNYPFELTIRFHAVILFKREEKMFGKKFSAAKKKKPKTKKVSLRCSALSLSAAVAAAEASSLWFFSSFISSVCWKLRPKLPALPKQTVMRRRRETKKLLLFEWETKANEFVKINGQSFSIHHTMQWYLFVRSVDVSHTRTPYTNYMYIAQTTHHAFLFVFVCCFVFILLTKWMKSLIIWKCTPPKSPQTNAWPDTSTNKLWIFILWPLTSHRQIWFYYTFNAFARRFFASAGGGGGGVAVFVLHCTSRSAKVVKILKFGRTRATKIIAAFCNS